MTAPEAVQPPRQVPTWTLSDRLRKIRRGVVAMDQAEFARILGVGAQAYAAWEVGRTHPRDSVALAKRIELATGVPASWTLGLDDPTPPSQGGFDRDGDESSTRRNFAVAGDAVLIHPQFEASRPAVVASATTADRDRLSA